MQSPGHFKGHVELSKRKGIQIYHEKQTIIDEQILPNTLDKQESPV